MSRLDDLRDAKGLRWHPWTLFVPFSGADGYLYASDTTTEFPLDIFSADEAAELNVVPLTDDVGAVLASPATIADAHEALRAWCGEYLGRTDVEFDSWES